MKITSHIITMVSIQWKYLTFGVLYLSIKVNNILEGDYLNGLLGQCFDFNTAKIKKVGQLHLLLSYFIDG